MALKPGAAKHGPRTAEGSRVCWMPREQVCRRANGRWITSGCRAANREVAEEGWQSGRRSQQRHQGPVCGCELEQDRRCGLFWLVQGH